MGLFTRDDMKRSDGIIVPFYLDDEWSKASKSSEIIIATNLTAMRLNAGMTQNEVADCMGITETQIAKIESGRKKIIDDNTFSKFVCACNG